MSIEPKFADLIAGTRQTAYSWELQPLRRIVLEELERLSGSWGNTPADESVECLLSGLESQAKEP